MPTKDQLEAAVQAACDRLVKRDRPLFERSVNERSFSHKFAMYLQHEVDAWNESWDVDCEFNRDARDTGEDYAKQLDLIDKLDSLTTDVHDEHAKTVFPDVIVHRRGPGNNLLVVEMKKQTASAKDVAFDKNHKLPAYVNQLEYQAAAFIMIDLASVRCSIEWIKSLK
jgi:DNA-directed RNA polymerase specialized sigma54-like protein